MTIVLGVIADADIRIMDAERMALEAFDGIPAKIRNHDDFVFHAWEIFSGKN